MNKVYEFITIIGICKDKACRRKLHCAWKFCCPTRTITA